MTAKLQKKADTATIRVDMDPAVDPDFAMDIADFVESGLLDMLLDIFDIVGAHIAFPR